MVGLKLGPIFYSIGTGSFVHCFFSTIAVRLENENWGSRFPVLMNQLYRSELSYEDVDAVLLELKQIQSELMTLDIGEVVWDMDDRSKKPPWGDELSASISNLSNYFVTVDGKDLFDVFYTAFDACKRVKRTLKIARL